MSIRSMARKLAVLAAFSAVVVAVVLAYGPGQTEAVSNVGQDTIINKAQRQAIPNRVATRVTWDSVREDSLGAFSTSDPSRLRIPDPGLYLVTVQAAWQDCSCGYRSIHLQIDGGGILSAMALPAKWEASEAIVWQGRLQAGQTLSVWVYQDSGSTLTFGGLNRPAGSSANDELAISRIG